MITPLLKMPNTSGGTFYTFPSAQRDLARIFTNDSYSFKFSHFACLNLKDFNSNNTPQAGYINFKNFEDVTTRAYGRMFVEQLQNYVMNYETAILKGIGDDDGYDNDVLRTPAERVFFNWLQKVNGIEFEYGNRESNLYYEKCKRGDDYLIYDPIDSTQHSEYVGKRTVKYIGNIDVVNSVEIGGDIYSEVYLHIPSSVGASYEVRFNTITDNNYNGGDIEISQEKILGQEGSSSSTTSTGLTNDAIYDRDQGVQINSYTGDLGYIIDFRDSFYVNETVGYGDIMTMNELSQDNFEFNAVLVYYDFTNNSTGETVTNLYGLLLISPITTNGNIERFGKYKTTNLQNGNSFALKLDIKIDAYPMSSSVVINNNSNTELLNTLQEYINDMTRLQQTIDIFNRQQSEISRLQNRVNELELLLYGIDSLSSMESRVGNLETRLNASGIADNEALTDLIAEINQRVDNFITSQNSVASVIDGYETQITHSENGDVIINSTASSYSINPVMGMTYSADGFGPDESNIITSDEDSHFNVNNTDPNETLNLYTPLSEGQNLAVIYVDGETCSNDLNIYIDDSETAWRAGQTLKLMIKDFIDFNGHDLYIHTGYEHGICMQNIKISGDEISTKPTIEIICTSNVMNTSAESFVYNCVGAGSQSNQSEGNNDDLSDYEIEGLVDEIIH